MSTMAKVAAQAPCADWSALCWVEGHPGLAAWVQAFGALIALAIAIALPIIQAARRRGAYRKLAIQTVSDVAGTIFNALKACQTDEAGGYLPGTRDERLVLTGVALLSVVDSLASIQSFELGSPVASTIWADMIAHLRVLPAQVNALRLSPTELNLTVLHEIAAEFERSRRLLCIAFGVTYFKLAPDWPPDEYPHPG